MDVRLGLLASVFAIAIVCCVSMAGAVTAAPQAGITVPDRFRHAEPFIRTLEAGGLVVQSIAQSTLEASFGGGQNAAVIRTDRGQIEIVVFPGAMDAEQLSIKYPKWNGNLHHYYIQGPTVRAPEDVYGQVAYYTLHKNWFIVTYQPELDGVIKRILDQSKR
jgi:hypothetical protein